MMDAYLDIIYSHSLFYGIMVCFKGVMNAMEHVPHTVDLELNSSRDTQSEDTAGGTPSSITFHSSI